MALEINYSPLFIEDLETILTYFDERNGSTGFSRRILKMIHRQIKILKSMPEIGRFDIYSCQTNPDFRLFQKT